MGTREKTTGNAVTSGWQSCDDAELLVWFGFRVFVSVVQGNHRCNAAGEVLHAVVACRVVLASHTAL